MEGNSGSRAGNPSLANSRPCHDFSMPDGVLCFPSQPDAMLLFFVAMLLYGVVIIVLQRLTSIPMPAFYYA